MKLSSHYVLREIAGDTLLIPVGDSAPAPQGMILLNEISLLIYQGIADGKQPDMILTDIVTHYDVEPERARFDMNETIAEMQRLEIIEPETMS